MKSEQSNGALVVLGMHRSGTSAVTGALGLCGAWIGEKNELTGVGKQNPKGFFERRDLRAICDALLRSVGADWWRISAFRNETVPADELEKRRSEFADIIDKLAVHGTWAVKEPRLCLLFPLLRPVVPDPICIIVFRNPLEVAESLRTRNGFSIMQSVALWEAYNRAAIAASEGFPRVFVSYESFVSDPVAETSRLVEELASLGVTGLSVPDSVTEFIVPELRRARRGAREGLLEPSQQELWDHLCSKTDLYLEAGKKLSLRSLEDLRDLEAREKEKAALASCLSAERDRAQEAERMLAAVYASTSWKIAAPVRAFSSAMQKLRRRPLKQ